MRTWPGGIAVVVASAFAACASGSSTPRTPLPAATDAAGLHAAIAGELDYDFDLAVFVHDEETELAGATDRPYSFDSITKTIVGVVLAHLDAAGTVAAATPVGAVLDAGDNAAITFEQLASHAAGLPRLAPNAEDWPGFDRDNPYSGYTAAMAERALRGVERSDEGEYSNFGFQLLGLALERATGSSLGDLARTNVFEPAGMAGASIPQRAGRLPDGLRDGERAAAWDEQLGGAGGAMGTIADLAAYARFVLAPPPPNQAAVARAVRPLPTSYDGRTGYGWVTTGPFVWHNGGSAAYSAFVAVDAGAGRAAGFLAASGDLDGAAERLVTDFLSRARR